MPDPDGVPLLPCPWCNLTHALHVDGAVTRNFWVSCTICDVLGPTAATALRARERWNKRLSHDTSTA